MERGAIVIDVPEDLAMRSQDSSVFQTFFSTDAV
jgi:hypothetical protein